MSDSDQPTQPVRAFVAVPIPADTRARVWSVAVTGSLSTRNVT